MSIRSITSTLPDRCARKTRRTRGLIVGRASYGRAGETNELISAMLAMMVGSPGCRA